MSLWDRATARFRKKEQPGLASQQIKKAPLIKPQGAVLDPEEQILGEFPTQEEMNYLLREEGSSDLSFEDFAELSKRASFENQIERIYAAAPIQEGLLRESRLKLTTIDLQKRAEAVSRLAQTIQAPQEVAFLESVLEASETPILQGHLRRGLISDPVAQSFFKAYQDLRQRSNEFQESLPVSSPISKSQFLRWGSGIAAGFAAVALVYDLVAPKQASAEASPRAIFASTTPVPSSTLPSYSPTVPASEVKGRKRDMGGSGVPADLQKGCVTCPPRVTPTPSYTPPLPAPERDQKKPRQGGSQDVDEGLASSHWSAAIGPALGKGDATFQPLGGIDPELKGWMLGIHADAAYASSTAMAGANLTYLSGNVTEKETGTHLNAAYKTVDLDAFGERKLGPINLGARGAVTNDSFDVQSSAGFNRGVTTLEGIIGKQIGDKLFVGGMAGFGKVKDTTEPSISDSNTVHTYGVMGHFDLGGRFVATGSYEKLGGAVQGTDVNIAGNRLKGDGRVNLWQFGEQGHYGIGVAAGFSKTSITFDSKFISTSPFEDNRKYFSLVLTLR